MTLCVLSFVLSIVCCVALLSTGSRVRHERFTQLCHICGTEKNPVSDPDDSSNTHADDNNNILVPIRGFVCEAIITNGADRVCFYLIARSPLFTHHRARFHLIAWHFNIIPPLEYWNEQLEVTRAGYHHQAKWPKKIGTRCFAFKFIFWWLWTWTCARLNLRPVNYCLLVTMYIVAAN